MSDPITKSVEFIQSVAPDVESQISTWQFIAANAFIIVGGIFTLAFMILILGIFVKALFGSDLRDLFKGEIKRELSMTKFWTNVAYFAATLAFLAANLSPGGNGADEMIWLIYLGTVGSTAIASKYLALKYDTKLSTQKVEPTEVDPTEK